jgi:uncharacterized protein YbjT (DUF2867 family)
MSTLMIGATGTVGREVVRQLHAQGAEVQVMTRDPDKAKHLPDGVGAALGDLAEPRTLPPAFRGMSKLFMLTPLVQKETEMGLAGVAAAKRAGVERIVYITVHKLEEGAHIPHFASKIPIVRAIEDSGIPYTLIEPNNFFQNDLRYQRHITELGTYPLPIGSVGVSRVDVRDIADAVVHALTRPGHEGRTYPLVGPEALTGERVAEIWSRELNRRVSYVGDDLDAWEEGARSRLPGWLAEDLRIMYAFFLESGLRARDDDLSRCQLILGHPPRRFEDFARETARAWMA